MIIPSDNYISSRDADEAERLELQHRLEIVCQGYYLHPEITLPANARVAEHCTGTAIWLREFAAAHPETECHGFDISDAMFPQPDKIPANVRLHRADVKKPTEERWEGFFDVVHLRLIVAAMRMEDWAVVLKNLRGMVKPGGWVQWVEDDRPIAARRCMRPVAPLGAAERSLQGNSQWRPPHLEILSRFTRQFMTDERALPWHCGFMTLDTLMRDPSVGNLEAVDADGYVVDREDDGGKVRRAWAEMGISATRSMLKAIGVVGADDEWSEGALKEIDAGAYRVSRVTVFIGRKKV